MASSDDEAAVPERAPIAEQAEADAGIDAVAGPARARRRRTRRKRRAQGSGAEDLQDGEDGEERERTGMRAEACGLGDYAVQMLVELRVSPRELMAVAVHQLAELGAAAGFTWLAKMLDVQVSTVREEAARMTVTLEAQGRSWDVSVVERGSRAHRKRSLWMECSIALLSAVFRQCSGGQPVSLACLRDIGMPGERAARIQAMRDL
jgi:hypothetical protein